MTIRRMSFAAACAALLFALPGCNGSSGGDQTSNATTTTGTTTAGGTTTGGAPAKKDSYTITMIAKSSSNPVFQSAKEGAEAAAAELSKSGPKITIDWQTPAD